MVPHDLVSIAISKSSISSSILSFFLSGDLSDLSMLAEDNSFSLYLLDAIFLEGEFTLFRIIFIYDFLGDIDSISFLIVGLLICSLSGKFDATSAYSETFFFFGTFFPPI